VESGREGGDRVFIEAPSYLETLGVDESLGRELVAIITARPGMSTNAIETAVTSGRAAERLGPCS
jgi:DNA-binding transcriptional MocR family regulator